MKKRILSAMPALAVMILIFCFSAQHSEQSNGSSNYIVDKLVKAIGEVREAVGMETTELEAGINIEFLTFLVRKLAHTMEYALLGFWISFYLYQRSYPFKRRFFQSLLAGFLYACTDELHQYFVPGRSCEFRDVLIDTNGVFLGTLAFFFVLWLIQRRRKKKEIPLRDAIKG